MSDWPNMPSMMFDSQDEALSFVDDALTDYGKKQKALDEHFQKLKSAIETGYKRLKATYPGLSAAMRDTECMALLNVLNQINAHVAKMRQALCVPGANHWLCNPDGLKSYVKWFEDHKGDVENIRKWKPTTDITNAPKVNMNQKQQSTTGTSIVSTLMVPVGVLALIYAFRNL
jgi:hypothetical protein